MAALLLLPSCNGKSAATPAIGNLTPGGTGGPPVTNSAQPPVELAAQLRQSLSAEFERLGIDPDKVVAAAPSGADNAVFDLAATVIDPDGPPDGEGGGELPPTGIELTWTERMIGDYDQNGEVNYSDITPLGLHFNSAVEYDDPALHGGFEQWPTGDLGDADPGAKASAEANWRLARIDGDANGELNFGDVTPLAVHWKERMDGYRVYRKAPGQSEFSVMEQAGSPADYTVEHPASPAADKPVQFVLNDDEATPGGLGDGDYAYYVAPYDAQNGSEGPASAVLTVNLSTQIVNKSPVARFSVSPAFAGAPAEITLDASASYDMDGDIATYEWDFDADGTPDWLSTDPVPETSSGGTVSAITPGADGVVTVTYNQGSAEWYYPSVAAIDDLGASSQPAAAKLGISGWVQQLVSSTDDTAVFQGDELSFSISDLAEDPTTHELVAAGIGNTTADYTADVQDAVYFARRNADGTWSQQIAVPYGDSVWHHDFRTYGGGVTIYWNTDGQPLLVISKAVQIGFSLEYWMMTAQRSASGTWSTAMLYGGEDGKHGGFWGACPGAPGDFKALTKDMQSNEFYLLSYDSGTVNLEYTGFDTDEHDLQQPVGLAVDNSGVAYMRIEDNRSDAPHRLFYWKRVASEQWDPGYFDESQLNQYNPVQVHFEELGFRPDGTPECLVSNSDDDLEGSTILLTEGSGDTLDICSIRSGTNGSMGYSLLRSGDVLMVLSNDGRSDVGPTSYCDRQEGVNIIREDILRINKGEGYGRSIGGVVFKDGTVYCVTGATFTVGVSVGKQFVSSRVDPRLH